jgi:Ser/Thr protein kinase RdoA (MazF antagonist)
MATLHALAEASWPTEIAGLRVYNWDGLFKKVPALCLPVDDVWPLLSKAYVGAFQEVARRVREAMENLGDGPGEFGLIHADLGVDANLLFWRDQPRAIDFDESGLGYWIYDLAVALEHCRGQQDYRLHRDALLGAYCEVRPLPKAQMQYLDMFMAALDVHLGLWANAVVSLRPGRDAIRKRLERCTRLIEGYLASGTQDSFSPLN